MKKVIEGYVEKNVTADDVLKYVYYEFCGQNLLFNDTFVYETIDTNSILDWKKIQITIEEISEVKE